MKTIYIKDLKKGQSVELETFAICEAKQAQDKNGKPYYDVIIGDKTGRMKGKIWGDQFDFINKNALKVGHIAAISGRIDEFRGTPQITIIRLEDVDESKLDDYLESSKFSPDKMWDELVGMVKEVKNGSIRELLQNVMNDPELANALKYYPAGIYIHHGFRSGLIQHILEIITVCMSVKRFYPELDYDLVLAGAILHDIGKSKELKPTGVSTEFTIDGVFVGHLVMSYEIMLKHMPSDMDERMKLKLKNMILGHNGKLELGSPVLPVTQEASLHSAADELVKLMGAHDRLKKQYAGTGVEITEFDKGIEGRAYVGK